MRDRKHFEKRRKGRGRRGWLLAEGDGILDNGQQIMEDWE